MTNSAFFPSLFFTVSIDHVPGFVSGFHEVPGGSLTVIDSEAYGQYIKNHDHVHESDKGPQKYFHYSGLEEHASFKDLSFQELFETSHAGQAVMAQCMATLLYQKYPSGIPHRIMMYLKDRVMDDAKHAMSQAEVACSRYQEQSEKDVVANMLTLLLRTRTMDRILDAAGEPSND